MKKVILSLVMGLGLVSFAQAEEECIEATRTLQVVGAKVDCAKDASPHFFEVTSICRKRIGGRTIERTQLCEAVEDGAMKYGTCGKTLKKLPKGEVVSCSVTQPADNAIASVKLSWKNKVCFTGTYGDCRGGGKQTKKGCEIGDTTTTSFYYDSGCTIAKAGSVETREIVGVPGGFGIYADPKTSNAKEKKLDTTPVAQPPKHGGFGSPAEAGSAK